MIQKQYRLKEFEVKKVLRCKKPFFSRMFVVLTRKNTCKHNRFAIVISGKNTKKAVVRNIFRRDFYTYVSDFTGTPKNVWKDIVFMTKKHIKLLDTPEMQADFQKNVMFALRTIS